MSLEDKKEAVEHVEAPALYARSDVTSEAKQPPHGIDAELAAFFAETGRSPGERIEITPEEDTRLRRMIHKRVLAIMVTTYFCQALDKGTINFASIMGIQEDTKLVGQQYAWLTTCLYIAILVWEYPTNRLLQTLPVAKYLSFNIIAWGVVLACTAACHNFTGLVIVRTLLGAFECVCQPAFVLLSTVWYKRDEQAVAIGAFYSMNGLQQCIGGLLAYGVSHITGGPITAWQTLFLLLGCLTIVWGVFVGWYLPDSPMRATCWSKEDRLLMIERVRGNDTGVQNKTFKSYQALEAFKDPKIWLIWLISFTNALPTGGIGAFSNLIIKAFGFTQIQTYLLAIAQGVIIMMFLFSAAFLSKRFHQRLLLAAIYTIPNIIGTIVFLTVPTTADTKVGLLISFYLIMAFGGVAILNLAIMTGNVGGRTKQVVANTGVFVTWAIGNAVGPQVFRSDDAPRYLKAFWVHLGIYALQLIAIASLRFVLMRANVHKRRAAAARKGATSVSATTTVAGNEENAESAETAKENIHHENSFQDMTDIENPEFRYVY